MKKSYTLGAILLFLLGIYLSKRMQPTPESPREAPAQLLTRSALKSVDPGKSHSEKKSLRLDPAAHSYPALVRPALEEMIAMIDQNRLCEYMRASPSPTQILGMWKIRFEHFHLSLLFGSDGVLNGTPSYSRVHEVIEFFDALLMAGMLEGVRQQTVRDFAYSNHLLERLEQEHPENAEYFYFHAYELALAGHSEADQRATMLKAVAAPRYESSMGQVVGIMREFSYHNPTHFYALIQGLGVLPLPVLPPADFTNALMANEPRSVKQAMVSLGEKMMNHSTHTRAERLMGIRIVQDFWTGAFPKTPRLKSEDPFEKFFEGSRPPPPMDGTWCNTELWEDYAKAALELPLDF